jgi:hypothetical protein
VELIGAGVEKGFFSRLSFFGGGTGAFGNGINKRKTTADMARSKTPTKKKIIFRFINFNGLKRVFSSSNQTLISRNDYLAHL